MYPGSPCHRGAWRNAHVTPLNLAQRNVEHRETLPYQLPRPRPWLETVEIARKHMRNYHLDLTNIAWSGAGRCNDEMPRGESDKSYYARVVWFPPVPFAEWAGGRGILAREGIVFEERCIRLHANLNPCSFSGLGRRMGGLTWLFL